MKWQENQEGNTNDGGVESSTQENERSCSSRDTKGQFQYTYHQPSQCFLHTLRMGETAHRRLANLQSEDCVSIKALPPQPSHPPQPADRSTTSINPAHFTPPPELFHLSQEKSIGRVVNNNKSSERESEKAMLPRFALPRSRRQTEKMTIPHQFSPTYFPNLLPPDSYKYKK